MITKIWFFRGSLYALVNGCDIAEIFSIRRVWEFVSRPIHHKGI